MGKTDSGELSRIFDRHFDDIYRHVAFRVAPDMEAARDIAQKVFLAALQGFDAYSGNGSILSWLKSIARHKVVDYFRMRGRQGKHIQESPEKADADAAQDVHALDGRPLLVALVMQQLPRNYAELLEEKYLAAHGKEEKTCGWVVRFLI